MTAALASIGVSLLVFIGGLCGLLLHRVLPAHHLTRETRDVVLLGTSMLSVIAALVLGLLISTARDTLSAADAAVRSFSADLIQIDQTLKLYGPETEPIRDLLRRYAVAATTGDWAQSGRDFLDAQRRPGSTLEAIRSQALALEPVGTAQRWLRDRSLDAIETLLKSRWQLLEDQQLPIRPAFLLILTLWITFIFMSFGFNAPRNATVIVSFVICALSVGASIFLILEMETPFAGLMQASNHSLQTAVSQMAP